MALHSPRALDRAGMTHSRTAIASKGQREWLTRSHASFTLIHVPYSRHSRSPLTHSPYYLKGKGVSGGRRFQKKSARSSAPSTPRDESVRRD